MSLDDGVYILKLRKETLKDYEYRISHLFAVENVFGNTKDLYDAFVSSPVYDNYHDATTQAFLLEQELMKEWPFTEHDVSLIDTFSSLTWNDIKKIVNEKETELQIEAA